jgi:hypothetical protein
MEATGSDHDGPLLRRDPRAAEEDGVESPCIRTASRCAPPPLSSIWGRAKSTGGWTGNIDKERRKVEHASIADREHPHPLLSINTIWQLAGGGHGCDLRAKKTRGSMAGGGRGGRAPWPAAMHGTQWLFRGVQVKKMPTVFTEKEK